MTGYGATTYKVILKSDHLGANGEKTGAYVDRATYMRNFYPAIQRNSQQTQSALRHFSGARSPTVVYSDCSKEICKAVEDLGALPWTSTPHRPQSNSLMEKQVRTLTDGVRAILLHPGFPHNFWPLAASYFCIAKNFSGTNGMSPYEKAHNSEYTGLQVLFGVLVYFRPMGLGRKSKFEPRLHTGAFVGWHVQHGMDVTSDYLTIAVEGFHRKAKSEIETLPVHHVREVRVLGNPHFPLEE